jgi:hypothetical protein
VLLIVDVASLDKRLLSGLTVSIDMDKSFKPLEASDFWQRDGTRLFWENQTIPQDTLGRYAVKCLCQEPLRDARFYATVSDASGQQQRSEASIPISPAQEPAAATPSTPGGQPTPGLSVKISTAHKPVNQGSTFSYHVFVRNTSTTEDRDVELRVAFEPGMTPRVWGTQGPTRVSPRDNVAYCDKIPSLPAGEQVEYTIMVTAEQVGQYTVRADVNSVNHPLAVSESDTIVVTAGP